MIKRSVITIGLLAIFVLVAVNSLTYAADAAVRVINTSGSGTVTLTVKNISDNQSATGGIITWSTVTAGETGWSIADQYIEVSHNDLPEDWGIQIYTDNENALADPLYTGTANPAGLVKIANTIMALPMAWKITDSLLTGNDLTDPSERSDAEGFSDYMWHYLKDKNSPSSDAAGAGASITAQSISGGHMQLTIANESSTLSYNIYKRTDLMSGSWILVGDKYPVDSGSSTLWTDPEPLGNMAFYKAEVAEMLDFADGEEYSTVWNQSGIAWNEGGRSGNPKKAYIYLASKFTMASAGAEYKTSMLTLEAFHGISPFPLYLYKDAPLTEYPNESGATLENHFAPSGWLNDNHVYDFMSVDPASTEVTPYSGTHSFKIDWNGQVGATGRWGGIMWLEPSDIWALGGNSPTHNGYDLRGVDYLSFWARVGTTANNGLRLKVYFGNTWDTSGQTPALWRTPALTTTWQQYVIPVTTRDMSNVTGGLAIVFDDAHDPNPHGADIYIDDVKFDKY